MANTLGFLAGVLFAHSSKLEQGFYPYAIALKTTPIIAIAPLLILWLGSGIESKIASSAIICFFPILVNTVNGLKSADEETLNLLKSYSASKWQIFTKIRLPLAAPYIFSALKISTGLAVVGAIVGEFVGSNQGIGYLILVSSYHLETAKMFAAIFLSAFIGITFFYLITWIEKKVVFWLPNE
ncbi:MAG TPA: ABC transporter permease [archaeon]|nr:ABC transporter permease [archaeon]